ncbi:MAG: hypothetical protein KJ914_07525 [Gammaproteobacteria bacterium]|nr:hypothetical protein [Gammaproteobacteria bacterium]MBU1723938.1 hypothetical protein [Gammaproteobacteria bacterium]MBU2007130.1 hypothetical protein [Gammaproteobacteria bacterium]
MTAGHASAAFRRIREQTGIDINAHRFRHTFASKLAKERARNNFPRLSDCRGRNSGVVPFG